MEIHISEEDKRQWLENMAMDTETEEAGSTLKHPSGKAGSGVVPEPLQLREEPPEDLPDAPKSPVDFMDLEEIDACGEVNDIAIPLIPSSAAGPAPPDPRAAAKVKWTPKALVTPPPSGGSHGREKGKREDSPPRPRPRRDPQAKAPEGSDNQDV